MLYYLLYPLHTKWFVFNLFRYITFRGGMAGATALILSFILGRRIINFLRNKRIFAIVREETLESQKKKENLPTMGGILPIITILISTFLWADIKEIYVIFSIICFVSFAVIGIIDDLMKVKNNKGIRTLYKIIIEVIICAIIGIYIYFHQKNEELRTMTTLMFFKNIFVNFGIFYIPFVICVLMATSNSTNLADGLDGLAIGLITELALTYAILAYVVGNFKFANYLNIPFIKGAGELSIFLLSVVGSGLGFLWYNAYPAQVIMGDTGSLSLGVSIGIVSVLIKQEILLIIAGGVFVAEAFSVIIQVIYYKATHGKRIFKMTPLHHHFEKNNIPETKIVQRFWIIGILCLLMALATLKIR